MAKAIPDIKSLKLFLNNENAEKNNLLSKSFYGPSPTASVEMLKKTENPIKGGHIVVTPDNTTIVINDREKPLVYVGSTKNKASADEILQANGNIINISETPDSTKVFTDLITSKRDILAVAFSEGTTGQASIGACLFDLNTLKKIEDGEFVATSTITSLSMNPNGDMLLGAYNTERNGYDRFHLSDYSSIVNSDVSKSKKMLFDNRFPNMIFSLANDGDKAFCNIDKNDTAIANNWETEANSPYDRRNYDLDSSWIRQDMVGMPNGGVLVAYGKSDGSSMLEWIGRRHWGDTTNIDKYRLFARWTNIKDSSNSYRTLPNYTLDTLGNTPDGWRGRIAIMRDVRLPVKGKVVSLNVKSTTWTSTGGTDTSRSITPLLLEMQPNGEDFRIKDVGQMTDFSNTVIKNETITINWQKNGGLIANSNYRLGFWNGRVKVSDAYKSEYMPTAGAIPYVSDSANYAYIADYYKDGSGSDETGGVISNYDIADESILLKPFPAIDSKKRNYALSFNISIPSHEFPPLFAKRLAISPDGGTLAILSTKTTDSIIPTLNLYDFNNYNYDHETQIEGRFNSSALTIDTEPVRSAFF